jgi:hypothetical protein
MLCNRFCIFLHLYISFQAKEVVQLIHQSSANTARERLPRAAKAATKYAEGKVRSGDVLDSDGSKYSPNSEVSDEDQDKESKPNAVKTKSPSQKQPANDIVAGDEEEDEEEEVSIICL